MTRPGGTHPVYWQTLKVQPPSDWKIERIEDYAEVKKGKLPKTLYAIPKEDSLPYLLIDGLKVRRRRVNYNHIEATSDMVEIKKGADHSAVEAAIKKAKLDSKVSEVINFPIV